MELYISITELFSFFGGRPSYISGRRINPRKIGGRPEENRKIGDVHLNINFMQFRKNLAAVNPTGDQMVGSTRGIGSGFMHIIQHFDISTKCINLYTNGRPPPPSKETFLSEAFSRINIIHLTK